MEFVSYDNSFGFFHWTVSILLLFLFLFQIFNGNNNK